MRLAVYALSGALQLVATGWGGTPVANAWNPVRLRLTGSSRDATARVEVLSGEAAGGLEESLAAGILIPRSGAVSFRHELARIAGPALDAGCDPARA